MTRTYIRLTTYYFQIVKRQIREITIDRIVVEAAEVEVEDKDQGVRFYRVTVSLFYIIVTDKGEE